MKSALILGRTNGAGLDRDAAVLTEALNSCGVEVKCPPWKDPRAALSRGFSADAAFHLERVGPWWWRHKACRHFLIPNQERFPHRLIGKLGRIDQVLCKSRHAEEIFGRLHPRVRFIGFTSPDLWLDEPMPDYSRFLHLAGRSTLKNTDLLLKLWANHPEWPRLTLIQHPDNAPKSVPENVDLISRVVPDSELRAMQNAHGIHLCPSLSEGWGHYIVEAMSCAAVVVTTDAPPMNELIDADRGLKVSVLRSEPRHLGRNFFADPAALESVIQSVITMTEQDKQALGAAARRWFEKNQLEFQSRLAAVLQ